MNDNSNKTTPRRRASTIDRVLQTVDLLPGILAFCVQIAALAAAFAVILRIAMPPANPDTSTDLIMALVACLLIVMAAAASWYTSMGTRPHTDDHELPSRGEGGGGSNN